MKLIRSNPTFQGRPVDAQSRCVHYHSEKDIIAIKFKCCGNYYPCFECHQETAGHAAQVWPEEEWNVKAVLCGACGSELTINEYLRAEDQCPVCNASFNPGCSKHHHLYFAMDTIPPVPGNL